MTLILRESERICTRKRAKEGDREREIGLRAFLGLGYSSSQQPLWDETETRDILCDICTAFKTIPCVRLSVLGPVTALYIYIYRLIYVFCYAQILHDNIWVATFLPHVYWPSSIICIIVTPFPWCVIHTSLHTVLSFLPFFFVSECVLKVHGGKRIGLPLHLCFPRLQWKVTGFSWGWF